MLTKTRLSLAVLAALGLGCASAFAMTNSMPADPDKLQSMDVIQPFGALAEPVARRGGTLPEDVDGFDDNGIDPLPHASKPGGAALFAKKGRGEDGTKPEDDGIDLDDGRDDNGIDGMCL